MVCAALTSQTIGAPRRGRRAARMPSGTPSSHRDDRRDRDQDRVLDRASVGEFGAVRGPEAGTRSRAGPSLQRGGCLDERFEHRAHARVLRSARSTAGVSSATSTPSASTPIRVASANASAMSCVTMTIVLRSCSLDPPELAVELAARDRIERAEGLVHQQNRRIGGERPRDADALALAARQLFRAPCRVTRRPAGRPAPAVRRHAFADPLLVPAEQTRHDGDVVAHRQVRKETDFLKDVADVPAEIERVPLFHGSPAYDHLRRHPGGAID